MANALLPCDPRDTDPCEVGICSGSGASGFYCRPACSNTAVSGDPCGDDDVCLSDGSTDQLACFNVDDCAFLDGDPCGGGDTCAVLSVEPLRTACVPGPGGDVGASCGPAGALACDSGSGCLGTDLDGDDAGRCQQWCAPGEALPDGCSQCIGLSDEIGTCSDCSVLEQDCPRGQACQPINELLGGACVDFGPAGPGEACDPTGAGEFCVEGSLCLETEVDDVFSCIPTCDPANPMCPEEERACVDLGVIVPGAESGILGVCLEGATVFCDPDADPSGCPGDELCLVAGEGIGVCGLACDPAAGQSCEGNFACLPVDADVNFNLEPFIEGNGACGAGCMDDGDCGGETCLLLDGVESDGICGVTCTPPMGAECGMGETCVPTPGDPGVGACVADGGPCDKAALGGCATAAACVALDGGASAVCMPLCFEQDPAACGGVPADCQAKTEPQWHSGFCFGADDACDPVEADCGPGFTCDILGGGAIGGVAFTCDDAGAVDVGGACDMAQCVSGVTCVEDVCREMCDPAADACSAGSCADISASLYLPAETLGACM